MVVGKHGTQTFEAVVIVFLLLVLGAIHVWGTTFGTKELRTMSHWILAFIMIYYYLINKF